MRRLLWSMAAGICSVAVIGLVRARSPPWTLVLTVQSGFGHGSPFHLGVRHRRQDIRVCLSRHKAGMISRVLEWRATRPVVPRGIRAGVERRI